MPRKVKKQYRREGGTTFVMPDEAVSVGLLMDRDNPDLKGYRRGFGERCEMYGDVADLVSALDDDNHGDTTILVKGSKASAMGRVVDALADGDSDGGAPC